MKLLLSLTIVLAVPLFFLLVFVLSEFHKLAALRERCRAASAPRGANPAAPDYSEAAAEYNQARGRFPTRLVAVVFGFTPAPIRCVLEDCPSVAGESAAQTPGKG